MQTDRVGAKPMMACGHSANAVRVMSDGSRVPSCAICVGTNDDNLRVVEAPDLTGRRARCGYFRSCGSEQPASVDLWFFEHRPDREYDEYYCACRGTD